MSGPSVFISYSHKDEEWKDLLVNQLKVLQMQDMLNVWDDRRIEAGEVWNEEIDAALNTTSAAVLIVTDNFLTSNFIMNKEVPRLLERHNKEGVKIFPLIAEPCRWQEVPWLSKLQVRSTDGHPLSGGNEHEIKDKLSAFAGEIATILRRAGVTPKTTPFTPLGPGAVSLAKLPSTSSDLFGRVKVLQQLDGAWEDPKINVLSLVAWGGVGKTALVNKWLSNLGEDFRGAERVYGWSFSLQGVVEEWQASADQFVAAALEWFGDPDVTKGSPWGKGERLAKLIKRQKTLLILDGLEPLQSPPPVETGKIKDPGLTSLLRELAYQNPGLVIISTRLAVDDLKDFIGSTALEIDLETLSDDAGATYLKHLGVDGTDDERKAASHDFGGHALALTLLGRYLKVMYSGDIRKRKEIPNVLDEQKQGAHARRVMESYERWLVDKPELDILRLMGLFDRPAESGAFEALRAEPAIQGLTDATQKLNEAQWRYAVNNLRDLRLIAPEDPQEPDTLDCHLLLREHFGNQLKEKSLEAWREGNNRLYEYYKASAGEYFTLQDMIPYFAAILHGCQAGLHKEAYEKIYREYVYSVVNPFSAFGADLAAISSFFEIPYRVLC